MGLLTDTDLEKIISPDPEKILNDSLLISPYNPKSLTPVGYDLRVGTPYATSDKVGRRELKEGGALEIRPGSTALISTLENIEMPKSRMVSGLIESKVTKVSKGLSHISTTVDPDWKGKLLIAVHNHSSEKFVLTYGDTFCTIVFIKNESPSTRECKKIENRIDVFLNKFDEDTKKSERKRALKIYIPPAIILGSAAIGYIVFGNQIGFSAMAVIGIAISQYVSEKIY